MDWTKLYMSTLIPQIPKVVNDGFTAFKNYLDVFYDETNSVIIKPINTTGRIKGTTGEFVNVTTDNLTVKRQFTNWYGNITTVDSDFTTTYNGSDVSTRVPSSYTSYTDASIWPFEPSTYSWVNVIKPYYKINNDVSYGFQNSAVGQEFRLIFDSSFNAGASPFTVLLESSIGVQNLSVTTGNSSTTWIKLITVSYDASKGPKWIVKESGGTYTIA